MMEEGDASITPHLKASNTLKNLVQQLQKICLLHWRITAGGFLLFAFLHGCGTLLLLDDILLLNFLLLFFLVPRQTPDDVAAGHPKSLKAAPLTFDTSFHSHARPATAAKAAAPPARRAHLRSDMVYFKMEINEKGNDKGNAKALSPN